VAHEAIRHVRPGEPLAIDPKYLRQSRDAFFWLFAAPIQETEYREDGVAVVHVRGPLEHHEDPCADSYDAICARTEEAFGNESAHAVVLCLDSPGGVVSGLNETVARLRKCAKQSGKRFVAYVDEMATSAAYALACACDEIVVPPSAITGSIGVISTMVDVTAADEMMGLRFVTIASGTRKADGHPHVPISDAAIAAETRRVEKLAMQFFRLVKSSRGLPIAKIQGFQAGIFLGKEAVSAGVADAVLSWEECLALLSDTSTPRSQRKLLARGGTLEPSSSLAQLGPHSESPMPLSLDALIKRTEAALASEKDSKLRAELSASLEAYKKTKHSIEKHETEEGDEEDEEDEDEEGGNETDRSDDPDDDKDDDGDEEDEDEKKSAAPPVKKSASTKKKAGKGRAEEEAEDEGDDAEALLQLVRRATGKRGAAAMGALEGLLSKAVMTDKLAARLEAIEVSRKREARDAIVGAALASNRITKKEAERLGKKSRAHVEAFLDARPRSLIYAQSEDLPVPQMQNPDGTAVLPPDLEKQLQAAITASEGKITRDQILAEHAKRSASTLNGRG
jgi:ClpP class serine protease